ncbi:hypothetical protein CFP56_042189 [Quercus suber]|uniref:Uncharacterized protein n=1 Tax=Quercus suber TaxID=58331 RepID=A0AAW0MA13_QUESU
MIGHAGYDHRLIYSFQILGGDIQLLIIILRAHSISSKALLLSPSYCSYFVLVTELIIVMTDSDPIHLNP